MLRHFFSDAFVLKTTNLLTVELAEVFRQKDEDFREILNEIRDGNLSREHYTKASRKIVPILNQKKKPTFISLLTIELQMILTRKNSVN